MTKLFYALIALLFFFNTSLAQVSWQTDLNNMIGEEHSDFGTRSPHPINFYTNDTLRMVLGRDGSLKFTNYKAGRSNIMIIDSTGTLRPLGGVATSSQCITGAQPWYEGGNKIVGSYHNHIGTCNNYEFVLKANDIPMLYLKPTGLIGLGSGNNNPSAVLDINDGMSSAHMTFSGDDNGRISNTADMGLIVGSGHGFYIHENMTANLNIIGGKVAIGLGYTAATTKLAVEAGSGDGIQSRTSSSSANAIAVYNTSSSNNRFSVLGNGKTTIGYQSNSPNLGMLNINVNSSTDPVNVIEIFDQASGSTGMVNFRVKTSGHVYCRELHVKINTAHFPDFVFEKDYKLISLVEREAFILKNKHLPYVLPATEIKEEGLPVTSLLTGVLQNTEELTLYVIELSKQIEALKQENEAIKLQLDKLRN